MLLNNYQISHVDLQDIIDLAADLGSLMCLESCINKEWSNTVINDCGVLLKYVFKGEPNLIMVEGEDICRVFDCDEFALKYLSFLKLQNIRFFFPFAEVEGNSCYPEVKFYQLQKGYFDITTLF